MASHLYYGQIGIVLTQPDRNVFHTFPEHDFTECMRQHALTSIPTECFRIPIHAIQCRTIVKSPIVYLANFFTHGQRYQLFTIGKSMVIYYFHIIRNDYRGQSRAIGKSETSYRIHVFGNNNIFQSRTRIKRTISYIIYFLPHYGFLQSLTALKDIRLDRFYSIRNMDRL